MSSRDYFPLSILLALALIGVSIFIFVSVADREHPAETPARAAPSSPLARSVSPIPVPIMTQVAAPRAPAVPSAAAAPLSLTITVQNQHCETLDYYVDGRLTVSRLAEGSKTTFVAGPGPHSIEVCQAGTNECGGNVPMDWSRSITVTIKRGDCPVTIKVTNKHCGMVDLYVGDEMVLFSLAPGAAASFQTTAGVHLIQACPAGSRDCGEPMRVTWDTSTDLVLAPEPDCP